MERTESRASCNYWGRVAPAVTASYSHRVNPVGPPTCSRHPRLSAYGQEKRSPLGSPVKVGESATTLTGSAVLSEAQHRKGSAPPGTPRPPLTAT
jgi:hypothetical protein